MESHSYTERLAGSPSARSQWLVIERTTGGAAEPVVWHRSSRSLAPGIHEDTITLTVVGRPDVTGLIVGRFEVVGSMSSEEVALHYLGVQRLTPPQVRFLIRFGNQNPGFDVGDVLRWFDHCNSDKISATGCQGSSRPPAERRRSIGPEGSELR